MKKIDFKQVLERFKELKKATPKDVVCLDVTPSGINAVRMRKADDHISLVAAEVIPRAVPTELAAGDATEKPAVEPLDIPQRLRAKHGCLTTPGETSLIKLLSFPGAFDDAAAAKVVENLGVDKPENFRISYKVLTPAAQARESKVLAVALPIQEADAVAGLLATGTPVPLSLEVSGLATMTAFVHHLSEEIRTTGAVGVIDFGQDVTSFALFNKSNLILLRRFNFGSNAVLTKVRDTLGVDLETAQGIIADGAFDISQSVTEVMDPIVKQLIVSRDFVERRENCHIANLYISGSLVVSRDAIEEMKNAMGLEVVPWSPFQGLTIEEGAVPEALAGQEWRFSAAVGAGLATFEET